MQQKAKKFTSTSITTPKATLSMMAFDCVNSWVMRLCFPRDILLGNSEKIVLKEKEKASLFLKCPSSVLLNTYKIKNRYSYSSRLIIRNYICFNQAKYKKASK